MKPKVVNARHPPDPTRGPGLYVGRPSRWGNKHPVGWCPHCKMHHTRGEAVDAFERDLDNDPELLAAGKKALRGRDLICWCSPRKCHADIWLKRANPES